MARPAEELEELLSKIDIRRNMILGRATSTKDGHGALGGVPGIPEEKRYAEMVGHIAKIEGTVEMATITIRKARD